MADQTSRLTPERLAEIEQFIDDRTYTFLDCYELTREIRRSWAQIEALRAMVKRMGGEPDQAESTQQNP